MKVVKVANPELESLYLKFPLQYVYKSNTYYRHTLNPITVEFLKNKGPYFEHAQSKAYIVFNGSKPMLRASLIIDDKNPDIMMVGFFEAVDNKTAVSTFFDFAKSECRRYGKKKLVIRMEGHLNNSLGFLVWPHNEAPPLGLPYTPEYYLNFFDDSYEKITSHSYLVNIKSRTQFSDDRIVKRISRQGFYIRPGNFDNLEKTIQMYTKMNNLSFSNHRYWAPRNEEEDYSQFEDFSLFLKSENLLICYNSDKEPVGFLLWYDDLNTLVNSRQELSLLQLIKYKLKRIRHAKLAEIAVIPEYQKKGIPYFLLSTLFNYLYSKNYLTCENGWIMDENRLSKLLLKQFISRGIKTYRKFVAYEWKCD